ncbi:MAG: polysaccharide deacetylase family protein [Betaproteobacteria bacterium]
MIKRSLAWFLLLAAPCALAQDFSSTPSATTRPRPVRFLLTFDDGPYGQERDNPTESILDTLAMNEIQQGMKAIFFLQTRSSDGGATERGRALMRREQAEGHLLALHDGSAWGHRSHRNLSDQSLEKSVADGVADLVPFAGREVNLLRPPYWAYDARTLAVYQRHGLNVLLTDISANDGKDWGFKGSPRRYAHMASEVANVQARLSCGELPVVDGVIPVVVAFHDTNTYTAEHMQEYFRMLLDAAREAGMPVDVVPFFSDRASLERAALARAMDSARRDEMVPWWWRIIHWLFSEPDWVRPPAAVLTPAL